MLTLVALSLFGHIDATHFAGALAEPPDLSDVPVAQLTHDQLLSEQKRLEPYRTAFIGPVVMTAVGGGAVVVGAIFGVLGVAYVLIGSGVTSATVLQYVGFVLIAVGGVAVIVGGIFLTIGLTRLFPALARRREASERREEIQKRLEGTDPSKAPAPQPVAPGVDVLWRGPEASVPVASF